MSYTLKPQSRVSATKLKKKILMAYEILKNRVEQFQN